MGVWAYYFFAKLLLTARGYLAPDLPLTLAFAAFTILPARRRAARALQAIVAVPLAIALMYHDSWLPPVGRIGAQADQLAAFTLPYLAELAARFVNPHLVAELAALGALLWLLSRKLRISTFAVLGILASPWIAQLAATAAAPPAEAAVASAAPATNANAAAPVTQDTLNTALDRFRASAPSQRVAFPAQAAGEPYDVLLLHVCSLSWDDLDAVGLKQHPFLKRMNLNFTRYNTAASYSGPAAIRLLRSACGQPAHADLYQPADNSCLLMDQLQSAGFERHLELNHNGVFGDFLAKDVRIRGGLDLPLDPLPPLPAAMHAFDGSPLTDDYTTLEQWWNYRLTLKAPRVALYYNSASLHDGNHLAGAGHLSPEESYRARATALLDGYNRFLDLVQASGRRAVVVLVPEHGANVRGDRMQISGLREIPSPAISLTPAGIALVGPAATAPGQATVDKPSALIDLAQLLAGFAASNPFAAGAPALDEYAKGLTEVPFVSENEGTVVMQQAGRYWLRNPDKTWTEYRP